MLEAQLKGLRALHEVRDVTIVPVADGWEVRTRKSQPYGWALVGHCSTYAGAVELVSTLASRSP